MVKNPCANAEDCRFHPLEEGITTFLPGESHGQRSLMGYSSKGHKKSDMTKRRSIKAKIMKLLEESMRKSL